MCICVYIYVLKCLLHNTHAIPDSVEFHFWPKPKYINSLRSESRGQTLPTVQKFGIHPTRRGKWLSVKNRHSNWNPFQPVCWWHVVDSTYRDIMLLPISWHFNSFLHAMMFSCNVFDCFRFQVNKVRLTRRIWRSKTCPAGGPRMQPRAAPTEPPTVDH